MKKLFGIFGIFGIIGCLNNQNFEKKNLVGGYQDTNIGVRGNLALTELIREKQLDKNYKILEYKTQVVAGINHKFILEIDKQRQEFIVFETLDGKFIVQ